MGRQIYGEGILQIDDTEQSPTTPVNFRSKGKIIYAGRNVIIPIILDTLDLIHITQPLLRGLNSVKNRYENLVTELLDRRHGTDNISMIFPTSMQHHLHLLISDIQERVLNLKSMLDVMEDSGKFDTPAKLTRGKRGLFNAGGKLASYLFGLVDSDSYEETNKIINNLKTLTEEERLKINLHSEILNITSLHMEEIASRQSKAIESIITIDNNLQILNATLARNLDQIYDLNNSIRMISAISYASSALRDLDYKFSRFISGLTELNRGYLSEKIIKPEHLQTIIAKLNDKNLRPLWPPTKEYIQLYYRFSEILKINTNKYMYLLMIPLLPDPVTELELYTLKTIPYPVTNNITISYGEIPKFFAISSDHSIHTSLTESDLNNCRQMNSIFFCSEAKALYKSTAPTCAFSLFTNRGIAENCDKHVGPSLKRPLVLRDGNKWLYATSSKTYITIVCTTKTQTIELQTGVGSIIVPQGCRVNSKYLILPISESYKGERIAVNFTTVDKFDINLSNTERTSVQLCDSDPLYQSLIHMIGNPIPLKSLQGEIGSLRQIQKAREFTTQTSYFASILGLALVAVLIIFMLCCCWVKHILEENRDAQGIQYLDKTGFTTRIRDYIAYKIKPTKKVYRASVKIPASPKPQAARLIRQSYAVTDTTDPRHSEELTEIEMAPLRMIDNTEQEIRHNPADQTPKATIRKMGPPIMGTAQAIQNYRDYQTHK